MFKRMTLPHLILLGLFVALPYFFPSVSIAAAVETVTESRYFQGLVRRDLAERAALAAATQQALKSAVRTLAKHPDLKFVHEGNTALPLPLEGLASRLYFVEIVALGVQGFPPNMQAFAEVRTLPPENLRAALRNALSQPDLLQLYALAFAREALLLNRYDDLSQKLLPLPPYSGGGQEDFNALHGVVRNLDALVLFREALQGYGNNWSDPEKSYALLSKAHDMAASDPLIRTALAEVLLRLNRPSEAMEQASLAVKSDPFFARAHDAKGLTLLRQMLPALAVESFSAAISLEPDNPAFYAHRASAHMIQEEREKMCLDFQAACSLGACEGLQWARTSGKCLTPLTPDKAKDSSAQGAAFR